MPWGRVLHSCTWCISHSPCSCVAVLVLDVGFSMSVSCHIWSANEWNIKSVIINISVCTCECGCKYTCIFDPVCVCVCVCEREREWVVYVRSYLLVLSLLHEWFKCTLLQTSAALALLKIIIIMEICTLRLKALNQHTHIMYTEMKK